MRSRHKDKRKNQVTTTAEKEDDTDSTATVTTAAFTSVSELEWDDDISEKKAETTTLNNQMYVFGKRQLVKPAQEGNTYIPSLQGRKTIQASHNGQRTSTNSYQSFHVW